MNNGGKRRGLRAEPLIPLYLGTRREALVAINLVAGGKCELMPPKTCIFLLLKKLGLLPFI